MLSDIPQVSLTPNADRRFFFGGQGKTGNIIVTVQFVPKTVVVIKYLSIKKSSSIIYSHIYHSFPIATLCYSLLLDFDSLVFALIRCESKDKLV